MYRIFLSNFTQIWMRTGWLWPGVQVVFLATCRACHPCRRPQRSWRRCWCASEAPPPDRPLHTRPPPCCDITGTQPITWPSQVSSTFQCKLMTQIWTYSRWIKKWLNKSINNVSTSSPDPYHHWFEILKYKKLSQSNQFIALLYTVCDLKLTCSWMRCLRWLWGPAGRPRVRDPWNGTCLCSAGWGGRYTDDWRGGGGGGEGAWHRGVQKVI